VVGCGVGDGFPRLTPLWACARQRLFAVAPAVYGNLHAVARDRLMEAAARHSATAHQALAYRDTALMEATVRSSRLAALPPCARAPP
jgi:hypothetical protein